MKRLRDKSVAAGWLWYEQGAKGRAARYFVTVPAWADGLDDGPGDEIAGSLSGATSAQAEPESHQQPTASDVSGRIPAQDPTSKRTESGRNVSTFFPIPFPN